MKGLGICIAVFFGIILALGSFVTNEALAQTTSAYRLMEVSTNEEYVYVADSGNNQLLVIDLNSASEHMRIDVGQDPRDIAVHDGKIYVTNFGSNTVTEINENNFTVTKTHKTQPDGPIGFLPWGIDPTENGIFVANWGGNATAKGTISVIEPVGPEDCSAEVAAADSGGPWGTKAHKKWIVFSNDGISVVIIIHVVTCEKRIFELLPNCGLPWDLEVTDDGEIVLACGIGPNFFPMYNLECIWESEADENGNIMDPKQCLTTVLPCPDCFNGKTEAWAAVESGDELLGTDRGDPMSSSEQFHGAVYVWDKSTFDLKQVIDHENYPNLGNAIIDVLGTPSGEIIISSVGTHTVSNKPSLLAGTPFDYSDAYGAKVNILYDDGSMVTIPSTMDTDNDGLPDDSEANTHGTEPYTSDTDSDGLFDGDEVNIHNTNPLVSDTDEDGHSDLAEINANTDPNDPGVYPGCTGECMTACAIHGSDLAPLIQELRETRDNSVLVTQSGSSFMNNFLALYYTFSPTIADWERDSPEFKEVVKITITPMLLSLSLLNHVDINSEEEMIGYGIGVILLNLGMYLVAPVIVVTTLANKISQRNRQIRFLNETGKC